MQNQALPSDIRAADDIDRRFEKTPVERERGESVVEQILIGTGRVSLRVVVPLIGAKIEPRATTHSSRVAVAGCRDPWSRRGRP